MLVRRTNPRATDLLRTTTLQLARTVPTVPLNHGMQAFSKARANANAMISSAISEEEHGHDNGDDVEQGNNTESGDNTELGANESGSQARQSH